MTESNKRRAAWTGAVVVLLFVGAIGYQWMRRAEAANTPARSAKPPPIQVTTTRVQAKDVTVYRSGIGAAQPLESVVVKSRIDGQLVKVGFVEGQDVVAGQMLAQLDPRTYQAQLAQAEAQRARDAAQLGNARADLQRYTTLIGEDAATRQQVDTQKALVAQLEAAVQTDEATIQYQKVQLSFTTIAAPISGRVGARLVDPGNIVHATDAGGLVVINKIDPIAVVFTLPEEAVADINRAQAKAAYPLTVEAYPRDGKELLGIGNLILVNNQIDTTTGTVQLKGRFPNPNHLLWPGQFVNVRLQVGRRANALTIPDAAVQRGQDGTFTFVVDADNVTTTRPIHVAQIQDGVAVVDQGLAAGERVVVAGQYKLKLGSVVAEAQAASGARRGGSAASAAAAGSAASGNASAAAGATVVGAAR